MVWFIQKFGLSRFEVLRERFSKDEYVQDHVLAERLEALTKTLKGIPKEKIRIAHERALKVI